MIALVVFIGAGMGGVARYAVGLAVEQAAGTAFPWATLTVNVTGSFLLGMLFVMLEGTAASPQWRAFLTLGLCGGYTTFSTFSLETLSLMQRGEWNRAGLYMLSSVLLSVAATFVGFRIAR